MNVFSCHCKCMVKLLKIKLFFSNCQHVACYSLYVRFFDFYTYSMKNDEKKRSFF